MLMLNDTSKLRNFTNPNWKPIVKSKLGHNSPRYPTYNLAYIFLSIIQLCWCIKQAFNICRVLSIIFEVKSIILITILCLCGMMQLMSPSCKWSLVTLKNHWFFFISSWWFIDWMSHCNLSFPYIYMFSIGFFNWMHWGQCCTCLLYVDSGQMYLSPFWPCLPRQGYCV